MRKLENELSSLAIKSPWLSTIFTLFFIGFSFCGLAFLSVNVDTEVYLDKNGANYRVYKELESVYGKSDNIIVLVDAKDGELFTGKNLATLEELTNALWQLPYVTRVDSITNHNHSWSSDDELYVEALAEDAKDLSAADIQRIQDIALNSPDIADRLVSTRAKMALIRVTLAFGKNKNDEEIEAAEATLKLTDRIEAENPDIDILPVGSAIHNYTTNAVLNADTAKSMPLMYGAIFILLGLLLRSIAATLMIFLVTMFSCLSALGISAWLGISLNTMSIASINIIVTVTIAHCVHIHVGFSQLLSKGLSKLEAIRESLTINMIPITLTSLTTLLGFLSMNLSKIPPAQDLGNISALGVATAYLFTLTLVPLLLWVLPFKRQSAGLDEKLVNAMSKLGLSVIAKRKPLLFTFSALAFVMIPLAFTNVMNDRFTENIKLPNQYREDTIKLDQHFGGIYSIEYNFVAKEKGGISDPEYLQAIDNFVMWLRQQPYVRSVQAYPDLMKRLNQNMHNDDPAYYKIPDTQEEAAQYHLLFEMSQPFGSDMTNIVTPEKDATRLIIALPSTDTHELIAFHQRANEWVENNMPDYMQKQGGSLSVVWAYLGQKAVLDGIKGAVLALFLISIILIAVFRSVKLGLISLIPNLLPMAFGYGIWATINGEITMVQTLVMSLTIGIVVDDTVHFLSKYIRAKQTQNLNSHEAVHQAFKSVGPALVITTVVLVTGFAMMLGSHFIPNSNMGVLTMTILASALLLDFFLLPPLLMWVDGKGRKTEEAEPSYST